MQACAVNERHPQLAVSAAIFRDGRVLVTRRTRPPTTGLYSLPGGRVETGETLVEAVTREVREETALTIEVVGLAGYREVMPRGADGAVAQHFVILPFAARWLSGEVVLNDEHDDARWVRPEELAGLATTPGLAEVVAAAAAAIAACG
jgi:ADP-ribose pyrophosphatase YjhB (NUDIX family)